MNIEAENLDSLRKLVRELQEENAYLKEKLKKATAYFDKLSEKKPQAKNQCLMKTPLSFLAFSYWHKREQFPLLRLS